MARDSRSSPVLLIAGIVSLLLAAVIAWVVLAPGGRGPAGRQPAAPTTQGGVGGTAPAATPTATPTPMATQAAAAPTTSTPVASPTVAASPSPLATATARPSPKPSPTASPATALLRVNVRNRDDEPMAGAELYLIAKTDRPLAEAARLAFAGKDGHSIVQVGDDGSAVVTVAARKAMLVGLMVEGEPQPLVQELAPAEPGTQVEASFVMPAPYEVRGTVSDEFAELLSGVPLVAEWQPTTLRREAPALRKVPLETDAEGGFSLLLSEPGRITLTVDRERLPEPYLYEKDPLVLTRDDFRDGRIRRAGFEVTTGTIFEGRVVAGDGAELLEGAAVTLRELGGAAGAPREWKATADKVGSFRFPLLAPKAYLLRVEHRDYNTAELRDLQIGELRGPFTVNMTPLAALAGVVEAEGAKIPSAVVMLLDRYVDRRTEAQVSRDGKLSYRFAKVQPGQYLVVGEHESGGTHWYGEAVATVTEKVEAVAPPLVLRPLRQVRGQFAGMPPGNDPKRVVVTARQLGAPADAIFEVNPGDRRRLPVASTSDSGSFVVENLLDGRSYALTATDRQTGVMLGSARVQPGPEAAVTIPLKGVGTISGVVRTEAGEACTGSEVTLTTGLGTLDGERGVPDTWTARAGIDGGYRFENVPAGQARLALVGEEDAARIVNVPRAGETVVDLKCRVLMSIEFVFEAPTGPAPREQFLVVAKPGTVVKRPVQEMFLEEARLTMEPGQYTITRTATMETQTFDILPRSEGVVRIRFVK